MTKTINDNDETAVKSLSQESLDDSNRIEAVEEHPTSRFSTTTTSHTNTHNSLSTTVPGAFQVRLPWARASSPAPSDDTEQWQHQREPTRMPNNNHLQLLEATMVPNDDDESVYDGVILDHMETSNKSRLRRMILWSSVVIVVALTIGLAVGLTRSDPPAPVTTRSSKLTWITNSSIERVAKSLPNETVTAILADVTTLNRTTMPQWYEQELWSPDNNDYEPLTAQAKAWKWLVSNATVAQYTTEEAMTRFALAVLYYQTGGPQWYRHDNWLDSSKHVCDWYFDWSLSSNSVDDCLKGGFTQLSMQNNRGQGSLPFDIGLLTTLSSLTFDGHNLTGSLPTTLCLLTRLEQLSLPHNNISGPIPSDLGALTKLTYLNLSQTNLRGPFPLSMARMTLLQSLDIAIDMQSMDQFPHESLLSNWTSLQFLQIAGPSDRPFDIGSLPTTLGLLTQSTSLSLWNLPLNGTIPDEIGNLTNLDSLHIMHTNVSGSLPRTLSKLSNLRELDLSYNKLTGSIPDNLWTAWRNIRVIQMGDNDIGGTLSTNIGLLSDLESLQLGGLAMAGTIPTEIGLLSQLTGLDLSGNL